MPLVSTVQTHAAFTSSHHRLILGTAADILQSDSIAEILNIPEALWGFVTEQLSHTTEFQIILEQKKVVFQILPSKHSRHNSPSNTNKIRQICRKVCTSGSWDIVVFSNERHLEGQVCAVAKAFSSFSAKTSPTHKQQIHILPILDTDILVRPYLNIMIDNVRLCASLVDQPPNVFHISDYISMIESWAQSHPSVRYTVFRGQELVDKGLNGIWNVGKAAEEPPAMITLQFTPKNDDDVLKHVCWVGKGIIYDTGGLSLKSKTGMPGMKMDMGGAAAVWTGFKTAVELGGTFPLSAILCLAENSIGSRAVRPDDIIKMYSGKTVEINNTDAEGRLVLADGVAWAEKNLQPDIIMNIATLTGAASTSVGRDVAAIYCNDEDLEQCAIATGKDIGELCHPLPYIPEKWKLEFRSSVADMRNSVANRSNAQSACAAQFVGNHLSQRIPWLHLDIAGAAFSAGRGTGFGMHLLMSVSYNAAKSEK